MKILLINPSCWIYGGAERVIVKLANWLTDRHHQVTLLTSELCDEMRNDFTNTRIVMAENFEDLRMFVQNCAQDFDVINVHNEPGHLSVFPRKRNVVWSCNEPPHLETPEPLDFEKECVRNFKVVVADEFNKQRFMDLYGIEPKIIPYGIDYDFFSEKPTDCEVEDVRDICENLGIESDTFVVTQVGFMADTKNQLRTIDIFKKLKEKNPEAKLILAGQPVGEYAELVRKKVEEYGLMQDVVMTGFVSREQVRDIYRLTDVALFPIKSQGGWLSVFEAMSAGIEVYVSKDATCSSILEENNVGKVCDSDDDFVDAIMAGQPIRSEWVKENLTWDKYCKEMLDQYGK